MIQELYGPKLPEEDANTSGKNLVLSPAAPKVPTNEREDKGEEDNEPLLDLSQPKEIEVLSPMSQDPKPPHTMSDDELITLQEQVSCK